MIMAALFRAVNVMRVIGRWLFSVSSFLLLAICCLLGSPTDALAQLWDTPPAASRDVCARRGWYDVSRWEPSTFIFPFAVPP